ncbi:MAG: hypothetical protein JXR54_06765, partial [Tannerellaceae bacterium]|nr:hypothetical protein [Tannerellaceae bacterium]
MTATIIITICLLLLFAYVFDVSSSKTRIPSVILLMLLGWGVRQAVYFMEISLPNMESVLPALGTIGLIMIVLEGALDIEINKSKRRIITKSMAISFLSIILISIALTVAFQYSDPVGLTDAIVNAIPFAIISSAIAIPSARNLKTDQKEFIIYESSFSDIFGVIIFNFIVLNDHIGLIQSINTFSFQ